MPEQKKKKSDYLALYEPLNWQKPVLLDTSQTLLLTGSAGGGKSFIAGLKTHLFAVNYPGAQLLGLRKVRDDTSRSIRQVLMDGIIPKGMASWQADTRSIRYTNGSSIYLAGMRTQRDREGLRSIAKGAVDFVWMEEAIEFEEEDYDEVLGRVRGTSAWWTQILLSTNPGPLLHWIRRRLIINEEATVMTSQARDNRYNPQSYFVNLSRMGGTLGLRLREGVWTDSGKMVVESWRDYYKVDSEMSDGGNVTEEADFIPQGGRVVLFVDDGYSGEWDIKAQMYKAKSHPRFMLLAQMRSDGRICIFAENHAVKVITTAHVRDLKRQCLTNGWPIPREAVYDRASPNLGGVLGDEGFEIVNPGPNNVEDSVTVLNENCAEDENGWRRVIVHPRCVVLRAQMGSYSRDNKGKIIKDMDDGPDALRYGVYVELNGVTAEVDTAVQNEDARAEIANLFDQIDAVYAAMGL